jgi:predicted membrane protein
LCTSDGFGDLRNDFFGEPEEITTIDTITAYILIWGSVLFIIFILFSFAIAVVFMSYSTLQAHHKTLMEQDAINLGLGKV